MSMEIKFRAVLLRNYEDKINVYQVEMINFADNQICLKSFERGNCVGFEKLSDCKLLQYTALKDCKGREIYEGDIVEISYKNSSIKQNAKVVFEKGCFFADLGDRFAYHIYEVADKCEIIGNIYEN